MLLESLWTLTWGNLRAFIMILKFANYPDSSHPKQAPPASAQPLMDQAPPTSSETLKESNQGKKITSSNPKEQAPGLAASQIDQTIDPLASKTKA